MLVGFTLGILTGYESEVRSFLTRVCLLENPNMVDNILAAERDVNVYTQNTTLEEISAQLFPCYPIEITEGEEVLVVSRVDFNVEATLGGTNVVLKATDYKRYYMEDYAVIMGDLYPFIIQDILTVIPIGAIPTGEGAGIFDRSFDTTFN